MSEKPSSNFVRHWELFLSYQERRDQTVRFLSKGGVDRNIIDYVKDSVDRMNEYHIKPDYKEDWQCISEDTQILGIDGWKNIGELSKGDRVLSFDIDKNLIEEDVVKDVFSYNVNGEMVSIKNSRTDQLVTTNHRVIAKKGKKKKQEKISLKDNRLRCFENSYRYIEANKLDRGAVDYRLPVSGYYNGDFSIGEDWAELIGWMLTDGSMPKGKTGYISQAKPITLNKLRLLLVSMGVEFREWSRCKELNGKKCLDEHRFYFPTNGEVMRVMRKIIPNRKPTNILWRLPLNEKMRLLESIYNGDGTRDKNGITRKVSKPYDDFKDWLQTLLHLSGLRGACASKYINIAQKGTVDVHAKRHIKNVKYNGKVWSIATNRTNYIARRNGKIFITGNSNIFDPKTRDKIIYILGTLAASRMKPELIIKPYSIFNQPNLKARQMVYSDLLEAANYKNKEEQKLIWEMYTGLSEGTVFGFESWKKDTREVEYVKEFDPNTGERKTEKIKYDA